MDKTQVWEWSVHYPVASQASDIYVWGSGCVGQLGLDPESEFELEHQYVSLPQRLLHEALLHKRVLQVCCGRDWTACLTDAGLYTWGSNAYNQLGHHHQSELFTLMRELKQSYPSSPDAKWNYWFVDEPVGLEHERERERESEREGQRAGGSPVEPQCLEQSKEKKPVGCRLATTTTWLCATPKLVGGPLLNKTIVHVACDEGDVFTWGYGARGALGHPNTRLTGEPTLVEYFRSPGGDAATRIFIKSVACGESFTIAVAANGHAYGWGEHAFGQLGLGPIPETPMQHSAFYPCPTLISSLAETNQFVVSVACGASHTLFLTDMGHVYSCGSNVLGQLGTGTTHSLPVRIESLNLETVTSIACGEMFSAAVTARGELWLWGSDSGEYRYGEGDRHAEFPLRAKFVGHNVRQVACGQRSVLALLGPPREASGQDYRKMLFARDFSDITFRLDNQAEIPAHKAILAARCPALLSRGAEAGGGAVLLPDVNEAVFRKLLEFIYTGDFALLTSAELNDELYRLALALNATGLVRKCALLLGRPVPDAQQAADGGAVRHIDDLREDLLRLLREPHFSDCTLRVEQQPGLEAKTFQCHRAVLSARCPFFEAMLSTDRGYKESQQAVISLSMPFDNDDVDAGSTVAELLKWIYAERFDPAPETSQALLVLADEYRLPQLAQMCETLIQQGVDETNVCDLLQFAETFRANKLRRYCIDYMAAPTFPSHLIDATQLKPELLEQIQLRKGSWSEHSRSRREIAEREARYRQYEEERQTQVQRWAERDSPLFALGQVLRESLQRFEEAAAQAEPSAEAPHWPRWMWRVSHQERRERRERLYAERRQRKEAKRLRRLEEQQQAAAAQRERDEAQRRKRERMNRVFIRAGPAASTTQERPADDLPELVDDDGQTRPPEQEEEKNSAADEGKTEKRDKGKEKAVDDDNDEVEVDDFEARPDLEQQQQGTEEEALSYNKATLTHMMDTAQQATDVGREVAFLRATLTAIQAEFGHISPKGALQLEVRALRREFDSIAEEARSLAPQLPQGSSHQALSQEVVTLRTEFDAIEREARQLVLERASPTTPSSLMVLPKEVSAIRAEFDAIEREAQRLATECRAHSIVCLLPKEVSAIRAEFEAIKRQAQQLAAWREVTAKEVSALREEFAAIELAVQALQIALEREAAAHEEEKREVTTRLEEEEEEGGYESEEEVKQDEEKEEMEEMEVRDMSGSAESPDGRKGNLTTDEEKEKDSTMEEGEDDDNEELNRAIQLVEQAFALEREDPAKADHLFTQSSIGFLQAMRIADAQGKSDVRRIVDGYIARIDARNLRRSTQMIKRKETESIHSVPEEEFMATSGAKRESCDYGQLVADSSEEVATVTSEMDSALEEEVVPQGSYLTAVLSDELPRRATNTPQSSPVVAPATVATPAAPSTADESEAEGNAELLASAETEPEDGAYMQAVAEEEEADPLRRGRASTVELRRDAAEAAAEVLNMITAAGDRQAQTTEVPAAARWKPADNNGARKHDALANTRVTAPVLRDINRRSDGIVFVVPTATQASSTSTAPSPSPSPSSSSSSSTSTTPSPSTARAIFSAGKVPTTAATRLEPAAARPKRPASTSLVSGRVSSSLASRLALFESPAAPGSSSSSSQQQPPQQPNTTQTTPQSGTSSPIVRRPTPFAPTRPVGPSQPPPSALGLRRRSSITTFQSPATTVAQDTIERYQQQLQSSEIANGQRPPVTANNGHEPRTLSYADLKDNRSSLPDWVDQAQLEVYLSDEDFGVVFQMSRQEFNALKPWRRNQFKKAAGLF